MTSKADHGPTRQGQGAAASGYFTVSIDDGHPSDLRTAELLRELGLKATFYVSATNPKRPVLGRKLLRELAEDFELGSHTFSHATLTKLPRQAARREVLDGKAWLEDITGAPVTSFCYPRGRFDRAVVEMVAEAGFAGARTCMMNRIDRPRHPHLWGVSTHACHHSRAIQVRHAIREQNWSGLLNFGRVFRTVVDWDVHLALAAARVSAKGGVVHLWLHSWEIDRNGEWAKLERALRGIRDRHPLTPVSNGMLFAFG